MQHRAKDFPFQISNPGHTDHCRADEMPLFGRSQMVQQRPPLPRSRDISRKIRLRTGINHRPHIGGMIPRITDPQFIHRAIQHGQQAVGDILLDIQTAQGRTPLPRRLEGRGDNIPHRLFRQRGGIHDHRIQPPGFRNQRGIGGGILCHHLLNALRRGGGSGKAHTVDAGPARQNRPQFTPRPRQQLQRCHRHPGLMQQLRGAMGDQAGGFRRFCQYAIPRRQRRRNLPRENRQGEVPRRNAGKHTTRGRIQTGRLSCVIAQEIHRLAQFGNRIFRGLACLAGQQGEQFAKMRLVQVCGTVQRRRTIRNRHIPCPRIGHRLRRMGGCRFGHLPHRIARQRGVDNRPHRAIRSGADRQRRSLPLVVVERGARILDIGQITAVVQIPALRIAPFGPEQLRRCRHTTHGRARQTVQRREWIGHHGFRGDILVHDLIHKGRIRPVFQQPPHQIGQQIPMRPHRRINPAAGLIVLLHQIMQQFAHAMQALELIGLPRQPPCHFQNCGHCMRVMGRKLRINPVRHPQQLLRTAQIGHIGRLLAGINRKTAQPFDLCAFDFRVPIGPLDQPHHDFAIQALRQPMQPIQHERRTFAIGLHHHAEPVPTGQPIIRQNGLNHVQRQVQPVRLFRVDVQPHACLFRRQGQFQRRRGQFAHDTIRLPHLVPGMQRGQFDGNAGVLANVIMAAFPCQPMNRIQIRRVIFRGITGRQRRFAQHVIGKRISVFRPCAAALDRLVNRLPQNKLRPQFLHCARHGGSDHRLAQAPDGPVQGGRQSRRFVFFQHLARQHQRPGRGIHQRRRRPPQMRTPFRRRDFILDQFVNRVTIRHPQQRLGQTHQGDAFFGGQAIFGQEHLHQTGIFRAANTFDQRHTRCDSSLPDGGIWRMGRTQVR